MNDKEQRFRALQRASKSALTFRDGIEIFGQKTSYFVRPVNEAELEVNPLVAFRVDCWTFFNRQEKRREFVLIAPETLSEEVIDFCVARRMIEAYFRISPLELGPVPDSEINIIDYMRSYRVADSTIIAYIKTRKRELELEIERTDQKIKEMLGLDSALELLTEAESQLFEKVPA